MERRLYQYLASNYANKFLLSSHLLTNFMVLVECIFNIYLASNFHVLKL